MYEYALGDIYKITLFGYALPYYIGVILRTPTQNHSYVYNMGVAAFI